MVFRELGTIESPKIDAPAADPYTVRKRDLSVPLRASPFQGVKTVLRWISSLVVLAVIVSSWGFGCQTTRTIPERESKPAADQLLREKAGIEVRELFDEVQRLRDREYETRPEVVATTNIDDEKRRDSPSIETQDLVRELFGFQQSTFVLKSPFEEVARYDAEENQILVDRSTSEKQPTLRAALIVAMVRALDAQHFEPIPPGEGLDRRLARFAARQADALFVAAAHLYERRTDESGSGLSAIARRPALALELPPFGDLLDRRDTDETSPADSTEVLESRMTAFGLREGLSLAAALHRSAGWSGVELLYDIPPNSTADIVRPDRWMAGEDLGTWDWSEYDDASKSPLSSAQTSHETIGPALVSIWIGQAFRPELARTVYSGWRSDSARLQRVADNGDDSSEDAWRFDWLQQWDKPSSARQIAEASRTILRIAHGEPGEGSRRWKVVRRGLRVGIRIQSESLAAREDQEATSLLQLKPEFRPRERLPITFRPTRTEQFRRRVERATVEEGIWSDPAAGLNVDVSPLQTWTFRISRTLPLRWFAKRDDGAIVQLTTELSNPLDPPFNSEPYRKSLRESFSEPLEDPEFHGPETSDTPISPTLAFSITGSRAESRWRIDVRQFQYGDVLVTLSLQAPTSEFSKYSETAKNIAESIETTNPPPGQNERNSNRESGTIEYQIEE